MATAAFDAIDHAMCFAVLADALGCEDMDWVDTVADDDGVLTCVFDADAVRALDAAASSEVGSAGDHGDWVLLASTPTVLDLLDVVGDCWEVEAHVAVEEVLADRAVNLGPIACLAAMGPVTFDCRRDTTSLLADGFPYADLAIVVG